MNIDRLLKTAVPAALMVAGLLAAPAGAQDRQALAKQLGDDVTVAEHAETGRVRFIGTRPGKPIPRPAGVGRAAGPGAAARAFVRANGEAFGLREEARELEVSETRAPAGGRASVRFRQLHNGVPVLGGELIVNLDADGDILSAGGELSPEPDIAVAPRIAETTARRTALTVTAKTHGADPKTLDAGFGRLHVFDSRVLGGAGRDRAELVYKVEVASRIGEEIREIVLVDALTGKVTLHFNQIAHAMSRKVCDANSTAAQYPCANPVRVEGGPVSPVTDVNLSYNYSGDTYNFLKTRFGRDSIDGAGMPLVSTVRYCPTSSDCPFANAFWDGKQMTYGTGYASADDVVGHEFAHGLTEFTSGLLYYYQAGAINESMSDVFGEFVDLTNAKGADTAGVRWKMGEDLPAETGVIRDMKEPGAFGDPDRMLSPNYHASEDDSGGVHSNSGVNNKAAYLMTDGGTFNGRTVSALGVEKVAKIYYEAQLTQLTSGSDYSDLYTGLQQACANLVGTAAITAANCVEVKDAVAATEMNLQPAEAAVADAPVCAIGGQSPKHVFFDDLENPAASKWAASDIPGDTPTRVTWYHPQNGHPYTGYDATFATSGKYNAWGDDYGDNADPIDVTDSVLAMKAGVTIPSGAFMHFRHNYDFESDYSANYDGGIVEYSVAGGAWQDAKALFSHHGYNGSITTGTGNPLAGRSAFVDRSYGYGSSRLNLGVLAGKSVKFRFRLATDEAIGDQGWHIDDIRVYTCSADATVPSTVLPTQAITGTSLLSATATAAALPTTITWPAATDDRARPGELLYQLQRSTAGGAYAAVTGWTQRRTFTQSLVAGSAYRYRVLVKDPTGNVSTGTGPAFTARARQENDAAIAYTGTWATRLAQTTAFGGFVRPTTAAGAKAATTFTGRNVAVVMPKASTLGSAKICLYQGTTTVVCQTVDLSPASGTGARRLAFVRNGLNPALSHRIEVTLLSGRAELDAILVYG